MTIKEWGKKARETFGARWCDFNMSENGSCEVVFWRQRKGSDKAQCTRRDNLTKAQWNGVFGGKPYPAKLNKTQVEGLKISLKSLHEDLRWEAMSKLNAMRAESKYSTTGPS